jgi:hypothetical protein
LSRVAFAPQFLRDFQALEASMSDADAAIVDDMLARVAANPQRPDRFQAFYDPTRPSWLLRADPFLLHYAHDTERNEVVFLNLFRRR